MVGKRKLAVCKELDLVWHGADCSVMNTAATSSVGFSKAIIPLVSASRRALGPAVTRRSGCCGQQGLCRCQPGMLVPSVPGAPQHAALGGSHSLQDWEEGERAAACAGKIGGIMSRTKILTSLGRHLLALLPAAHGACLTLSCFSLRST